MADEKKGITVKIDADLHAEIREYLERHEGMTMAEFITLAVDDELHPKIQQKEGNNMGNMRTMAFQVPEELYQRIKDYLHRNNMSQKEFVLGLIETELDREQAERESQIDAESPTEDTCEEADEEAAENGFAGECEGDNSADEETEDEDESEGFGMTMYAAYLDGSSMLTIAEQLNREKIEYRDGVTGWNKGRLKHLMDNTKYLGTEVYPPIIDQATYEKMQKTKHGRNTQKNTDKAQDKFKLTVPVRCPSCGDRMRRRHDSRCKCQERWTCENKDCRLRIEISDAELLTALADLLGTVTADSITLPAETPYEPSPEVIRLNNEISRMLDMAEIDKAVLRSKMTKCLARKYKELDNGCCAVQRLKAELGSTADIAERLNRTVSEIRLYTDKTADIILLNGQIIRKESDNGTDCCIPAESGADNRTDNIGQRERENPLPSPAGGGILPRFH